MGSSLPAPDSHMNVLYRQTYNTLGKITTAGLTQDNRVGNVQKVGNTRLDANTNKGILAGSVVAVGGDGLIVPATRALSGSDSTNYDKVVGIAVNDALGNPYTSSSAVASERVVYAHGSGTVFSTDIYETVKTDGATALAYVAGDLLYSSQNGLLTKSTGLDATTDMTVHTKIGVVLKAPSGTDYYMNVQMFI